MALGGEQLEPEDATNFSVGVVWDVTDSLSLTADFFQIQLKDRISQTGSIVIGDIFYDAANPPPEFEGLNCPTTIAGMGNLSQCLQELGVPGAADLNSVSFYTNDFETTTTGIDLVATWAVDMGGAGDGNLTVAWNWTETDVDDAGEEVSRNRVVDLENFNPHNRGIFTYNHFVGDWRFLARASFYDEWVNASYSGDPTDPGPKGNQYTLDCAPTDLGGGAFDYNDNCYDSEWIVDFEAAYSFTENWTAIVGVQNAFDTDAPVDRDNLDLTIGSGNTFDTGTPFGYDGGFWYFRVRADFQ